MHSFNNISLLNPFVLKCALTRVIRIVVEFLMWLKGKVRYLQSPFSTTSLTELTGDGWLENEGYHRTVGLQTTSGIENAPVFLNLPFKTFTSSHSFISAVKQWNLLRQAGLYFLEHDSTIQLNSHTGRRICPGFLCNCVQTKEHS